MNSGVWNLKLQVMVNELKAKSATLIVNEDKLLREVGLEHVFPWIVLVHVDGYTWDSTSMPISV